MVQKHCPYGTKPPVDIPETADSILDEFFELMKSIEVRCYIAFGTCLGFVRDGGYIPGDNDIDVVAFTPTGTLAPDISDLLQANGYTRRQIFPPLLNNTHFHKNNILLDVHSRTPNKLYAKLGTIEYKGKTYPVPYPVEAYLERHYKNWKVPV